MDEEENSRGATTEKKVCVWHGFVQFSRGMSLGLVTCVPVAIGGSHPRPETPRLEEMKRRGRRIEGNWQ